MTRRKLTIITFTTAFLLFLSGVLVGALSDWINHAVNGVANVFISDEAQSSSNQPNDRQDNDSDRQTSNRDRTGDPNQTRNRGETGTPNPDDRNYDGRSDQYRYRDGQDRSGGRP